MNAPLEETLSHEKLTPRWLVGGSVLAALVTSSCCLGPLLLISFGVSGAWIGNLGALKAYQPMFIAIALVFLGLGYWQVYRKQPEACSDNGYCAKPQSRRVLKIILGCATILILLAITTDYWAPFFY
jgi:mercuric ion transport protein